MPPRNLYEPNYSPLSTFSEFQPFEATAQPSAVSGNIAALPGVGQIASGINAINLGYQAGAIPNYTGLTTNVSEEAARLLNPADAQANYDVSMQGAESAVGRGIPGSGAAANQLLSSQVQRLPAPFNPATQLIQPSQISAQDAALLETLIRRGPPGGGGTPGISYPGLRGGGSAGPAPAAPVGAPAPYTMPLPPLPGAGGQSIGLLPDEWDSYTDEEKSAWIAQQQGGGQPIEDLSAIAPVDYAAIPAAAPTDVYGGDLEAIDTGGY